MAYEESWKSSNRKGKGAFIPGRGKKKPQMLEGESGPPRVIKRPQQIEADTLLKEMWQYMEQQGYVVGDKGSHGLKGKIGEYLIKYNIQ